MMKKNLLMFGIVWTCITLIIFGGATLLGKILKIGNDKPIVKKNNTIYKEYVFVRVDNSDRLLVSKEWFDILHTDRNIDIIINNEKHLGRFKFDISDTLKSQYLIGEKFLKKNGVRLFMYNNEVKCLYTNSDNDVELYKDAMRCIDNSIKDRGIELFKRLLQNKRLSNLTQLDALECFRMEDNKDKWLELMNLYNNCEYKKLDFHSRNKVELYIL